MAEFGDYVRVTYTDVGAPGHPENAFEGYVIETRPPVAPGGARRRSIKVEPRPATSTGWWWDYQVEAITAPEPEPTPPRIVLMSCGCWLYDDQPVGQASHQRRHPYAYEMTPGDFRAS